jgi:hypothetical protein
MVAIGLSTACSRSASLRLDRRRTRDHRRAAEIGYRSRDPRLQVELHQREAFVSCLREYPEIYVSTLVSRLREADDAMAAASFLTVKARVARALLELAKHLGRDTESGRIGILHKIRQSDIAAMAGVAPFRRTNRPTISSAEGRFVNGCGISSSRAEPGDRVRALKPVPSAVL